VIHRLCHGSYYIRNLLHGLGPDGPQVLGNYCLCAWSGQHKLQWTFVKWLCARKNQVLPGHAGHVIKTSVYIHKTIYKTKVYGARHSSRSFIYASLHISMSLSIVEAQFYAKGLSIEIWFVRWSCDWNIPLDSAEVMHVVGSDIWRLPTSGKSSNKSTQEMLRKYFPAGKQ